jgi:hypothetical protein
MTTVDTPSHRNRMLQPSTQHTIEFFATFDNFHASLSDDHARHRVYG